MRKHVWVSLRLGYNALVESGERDPEGAARTMRIVNSTPSLRAHTLGKHIAWAVDLTPEVARRLGDTDAQHLEADAIVHASFACLDVALAHFVPGRDASLSANLDAALNALRPDPAR